MLPKGWAETTLGEIGAWGSGGTPKASIPSFYGGSIPWVRSGDLPDGLVERHEVTITDDGLRNSAAKWVPPGSVLIAMYGATIGKVGLSTYSITTNQAVAFIKPFEQISVHFLFALLKARKQRFVELGQGGAQPNISQEILKQQSIDLPPLAEQHRIVAKLDALTARLARARVELEQVTVLAEHLRNAALATAFARDLGVRTTLSALTAETAPIRYGVLQPGAEGTIGIPLVRVCDLKHMRIAWPELRRIAPEIDQQFINARVQDDDILISVVGTIGRVALVQGLQEPTNIARAVVRLRPDKSQVIPAWLIYRLVSPDCQEVFAGDAREVARKTLNTSFIKAMEITLPQLSDQTATVDQLDAAFARADRLEAEAARARALLDRLEATILAKAFRGELVPQDPADEPASALLDRIRAERAAAPKPKRGRRAQAPRVEP